MLVILEMHNVVFSMKRIVQIYDFSSFFFFDDYLQYIFFQTNNPLELQEEVTVTVTSTQSVQGQNKLLKSRMQEDGLTLHQNAKSIVKTTPPKMNRVVDPKSQAVSYSVTVAHNADGRVDISGAGPSVEHAGRREEKKQVTPEAKARSRGGPPPGRVILDGNEIAYGNLSGKSGTEDNEDDYEYQSNYSSKHKRHKHDKHRKSLQDGRKVDLTGDELEASSVSSFDSVEGKTNKDRSRKHSKHRDHTHKHSHRSKSPDDGKKIKEHHSQGKPFSQYAQELEEIPNEKSIVNADMQRLIANIDDLTYERDQSVNQIQALRYDLEKYTKTMHELETENQKLRHETNAKLEDKAEQVKAQALKIAALEQTLAALEQTLKDERATKDSSLQDAAMQTEMQTITSSQFVAVQTDEQPANIVKSVKMQTEELVVNPGQAVEVQTEEPSIDPGQEVALQTDEQVTEPGQVVAVQTEQKPGQSAQVQTDNLLVNPSNDAIVQTLKHSGKTVEIQTDELPADPSLKKLEAMNAALNKSLLSKKNDLEEANKKVETMDGDIKQSEMICKMYKEKMNDEIEAKEAAMKRAKIFEKQMTDLKEDCEAEKKKIGALEALLSAAQRSECTMESHIEKLMNDINNYQTEKSKTQRILSIIGPTNVEKILAAYPRVSDEIIKDASGSQEQAGTSGNLVLQNIDILQELEKLSAASSKQTSLDDAKLMEYIGSLNDITTSESILRLFDGSIFTDSETKCLTHVFDTSEVDKEDDPEKALSLDFHEMFYKDLEMISKIHDHQIDRVSRDVRELVERAKNCKDEHEVRRLANKIGTIQQHLIQADRLIIFAQYRLLQRSLNLTKQSKIMAGKVQDKSTELDTMDLALKQKLEDGLSYIAQLNKKANKAVKECNSFLSTLRSLSDTMAQVDWRQDLNDVANRMAVGATCCARSSESADDLPEKVGEVHITEIQEQTNVEKKSKSEPREQNKAEKEQKAEVKEPKKVETTEQSTNTTERMEDFHEAAETMCKLQHQLMRRDKDICEKNEIILHQEGMIQLLKDQLAYFNRHQSEGNILDEKSEPTSEATDSKDISASEPGTCRTSQEFATVTADGEGAEEISLESTKCQRCKALGDASQETIALLVEMINQGDFQSLRRRPQTDTTSELLNEIYMLKEMMNSMLHNEHNNREAQIKLEYQRERREAELVKLITESKEQGAGHSDILLRQLGKEILEMREIMQRLCAREFEVRQPSSEPKPGPSNCNNLEQQVLDLQSKILSLEKSKGDDIHQSKLNHSSEYTKEQLVLVTCELEEKRNSLDLANQSVTELEGDLDREKRLRIKMQSKLASQRQEHESEVRNLRQKIRKLRDKIEEFIEANEKDRVVHQDRLQSLKRKYVNRLEDSQIEIQNLMKQMHKAKRKLQEIQLSKDDEVEDLANKLKKAHDDLRVYKTEISVGLAECKDKAYAIQGVFSNTDQASRSRPNARLCLQSVQHHEVPSFMEQLQRICERVHHLENALETRHQDEYEEEEDRSASQDMKSVC